MYKKLIKTLLLTGIFAVTGVSAQASTLNEYLISISDGVISFPNLIAFICYLGGFVLIALGVHGLRKVTEGGQEPLKVPVTKLAFGGFFMALPPIVSAVQGTAGGGDGSAAGGSDSPDTDADTVGGLIDQIVANSSLLPDAISFLAYLMGFLFVAAGLYKLKNHFEFGPQNVPLPDAIKFIAVGGLVMSLPLLSDVAFGTFGSDADVQNIGWDQSGATSGTPGTLDDMMVRMVANIYWPFNNMLVFFCYIAGTVMTLIGLHRFTKTAQQGPQGPTGLGTIGTFLLAAALFSIAPMVGTMTETIFGGRDSYTEVAFMAIEDSMSDEAYAHTQSVITAILAFLIIVGILSIVRGFFVLRDVAEGGQQASVMGGLSHVIAGAILVNFGQFANIIQTTLGINAFGVQFQ
jgi:hypothetical protein